MSIHHLTNYARLNARGIPTGHRAGSQSILSLRGIFKIFTLFTLTQVLFFVIAGICVILGIGAQESIMSNRYLSWFMEYWPLDWDIVFQGLTWFGILNFGWSGLILFNHWNDVLSMLASLNDYSITGIFATVYAYWYVTCWTIGYEFFQTISSDPMNIFNTRAILELTIGYGNVCYYLGVSFSLLTSWLPEYLTPFILVIQGWFVSGSDLIVSKIVYVVKSAWTLLVTTISTWITPVVPTFLQPTVNSVSTSFSKMIASMIILWIIRIFFGFPF